MRLNKYIASCGVCSRSEADKLIASARNLLNGSIPTQGADVTEDDKVLFDGKEISPKQQHTYIAYYKPVGVVCTKKDPHAKRTVADELKISDNLTYAGRLDKDSEGLLIMTDDGDLINAMMRARNSHEKEYEVTIDKAVTEDFISKMSKGVYLKELDTATRPCEVRRTGERSFDIILTQGLNRQIRRMCSELGAEVISLKRTRVVNIRLVDLGIKCGEHTIIPEGKIEELYRLTGLTRN